MTALVMLLGGGVLLYFGAEWLVGGASGLAQKLGVPQLLIGLTVVAYGTSAPEIVVGVKASLAGSGAITLGNVIGSNIANLGLILGITALIQPPAVAPEVAKREVPVLAMATMALPLVLLDGVVSRLEGAVLTAGAIIYTASMVRAARGMRARAAAAVMEQAADVAGAPERSRSTARLSLTTVAGLGFLVLGGSLFVDGASGLARLIGMSERLIGLTVVAVGTSLPELATSVIAARRGHADIAVGNVVGSNVFNILISLGLAAVVAPVPGDLNTLRFDLSALGLLTIFTLVLLRSSKSVSRLMGGIYVASWVAFNALLAVL